MLPFHGPTWSAFLAMAGFVASAGAAPDFEREVAPILEAKCLFCHNAESKKGKFDLSSPFSARSHPSYDEILDLVSGPAPEMPKDEPPLTRDEVKILAAWIAEGASWPEGRQLAYSPKRDLDWWSLKPLQEGRVDLSNLSGRNPIDHFIDKKLAEKGLKPLGPADPATLVRRLSYDLTGLPPSPEAVSTFESESIRNPQSAIRKLAERLLASPAFGEKFGQHWLDLARYGETHGYDKDKPRNHAWPYRDYVIRGFNEDKPYGRFVREQVAGDVLYPGTPDGVVALGFLAAGPWDLIGHIEVGEGKLDGRIAKHLDRDEMVSAVFNVFQSTTVQCAQCHHHKFDPVRMEDYYRLHAVFAAVDRADRVYAGLLPEQEKKRLELTSKINSLKGERSKLESDHKKVVAATASGVDQRIADLKEKHVAPDLRPQYGFHSQIVNKPNEEKWVQLDLGRSVSVAEIRLRPAYDDFAGIGAGFGFPLRYRVEGSDDAAFKTGVTMLRDATDRDQVNPRTTPVSIAAEGRTFRYLRITATKLAERKDDYMLALAEIEVSGAAEAENLAKAATVSAKDSIESGERWRKTNLVDGLFHRELSDDKALAELQALQAERRSIEESLRSPENEQRIETIGKELAPLEEQLKAIPQGELVYAAATQFNQAGSFRPTGGKPRAIHVLHRGDLKAPGEAVAPGAVPLWPGAPETFPGFTTEGWDEGKARAELADTLVRHDNPLVWRSLANRIWQWTMGTPLVGTPNDFGRGGLQPTHPELLDYLAARLRDDPDQSVKSLVRLIVTSEVYRRASDHDEANAAIDAGNSYHWRANRRRLSAEEFRDSVLAVSGKLNREAGGKPFQDFIIEKPEHSPHYQYHLHDPDDPASHRRTIYRFVVRSQPQPMLTTLDCADPSMSVPSRDESTTALQALTQWNSRFVEAMAVHFAGRLKKEAPESPEAKVELACRLATGRAPSPEEREVLVGHLKDHGEDSLARVVLNLNAFVYVD
jgi:mono/diheme cytochrome c family protein